MGLEDEGKSRQEGRDFKPPWMGTTRAETFTLLDRVSGANSAIIALCIHRVITDAKVMWRTIKHMT
jgi:hypothetical protein